VLTGLPPGQWSVPGLSAELGMPTASIYNWIYRGWITARRAPGTRNWIITADDEQIRQLRERRARPPGYYARARWHRKNTSPMSSKEHSHEKERALTSASGGQPRPSSVIRPRARAGPGAPGEGRERGRKRTRRR
jgi:hypothetical protein